MWSAIVSFFGSSFSTYAIIGLLVALCGSGALYKCERDDRIKAEQDVAVATEVNKTNEEAAKTIAEFRESADKAITALADSKEDMERVRESLSASVQRLVTDNEEFRKWFSSRLHPDAVRLFNEAKRSGATSSDGKQASGIPAQVDK